MSNALVALTQKMAARFDIESQNSKELVDILKQTAFKTKDGVITDAQLSALMIISQQYGLNPFTKEIYAYPDKGAIVPVVSVDGWNRIANDHPQYEGIEFRYSEETLQHKGKLAHEWVECVVYRKDRTKPTIVREYFDEVCRTLNFATPWDTHPKRMHRHKAMIQGLRIAFGFSGIYDQDEAQEMVEKEINPIANSPKKTSVDELLLKIDTMSKEEIESIDPLLYTKDEQRFIRPAAKARKQFLAAQQAKDSVVAEVKAEVVDEDWATQIKSCGDKFYLEELLHEMPEHIQIEFGDIIDAQFDLLG